MRIGVLGSGDVGRVLATGFVKHGHHVMIGSRDPKQEKLQAWVKAAGPTGSAGTFAETADLEQVTGFKPQTPIREGIGRFVEWYRSFYKA